MSTRSILFDSEAHAKIEKGVETIARAVGTTMGPKGRSVAIETKDPFQPPTFTVDGVTVANNVELSDPFERLGADAVRTASRKTNDLAGDGTTTAAVLAHAIYAEGMKRIRNGENPVSIKEQIEKETKQAVEALKAMAIPVADHAMLEKVAAISAKDKELGKIIAGVIAEAGEDGLVTIEAAPIFGIETEITRGFRIDTGYVAPWMVTNSQKMTTEMTDTPILVTDGTVDGDIAHLMNRLLQKGVKRLFIVADGFSPEALAIMFTNGSSGKFVCIGIRATGMGDHRKKEALRDLCAATGATLITDETGKTVKDATAELLGTARQITVGKDDTVIVEGAAKPDEVEARIGLIKKELETEKSIYNIDKLKERLGRLTGIAAIIKVGGNNDAEIRERKQRVEDAVGAVKAAKAEGIVVGGGISLVRASSQIESSILRRALQEPVRRIAENAGFNGEVVLEKCLSLPQDGNEGFNASTGQYEDLVTGGVIDPLRVTRIALENAASVSGLLLTTDVLIVEEKEKK